MKPDLLQNNHAFKAPFCLCQLSLWRRTAQNRDWQIRKKNTLEERICPFCDEIENEAHVLFNCDLYHDFRNELFRKALNVNPDFNVFSSEEKLIFLFSNHFMIRYTAKTCFNILQRTFYLSK